MPCSKCGLCGHNARTCSQEPIQTSVQENNDLNGEDTMKIKEKKVKTKGGKKEKEEKGGSDPKKYFCYFLGQVASRNGRGPTYNGYTVNLNRRLRQHNGEIKGGAFATKEKGPWHFIAVLTCESWTSVRAMQVEWLCRYPTRKKPRPQCFAGPEGRMKSLVEVFKRLEPGECTRLFVRPEYFDLVQNILTSDNSRNSNENENPVTLVKSIDELIIGE